MSPTVSERPNGHKNARGVAAIGLALAACILGAATLGSEAAALGESTEIDVRQIVYDGGNAVPRPSAKQRLAWEVRKRASIGTLLRPSEARLDDPSIFATPFLYWTGDRAFPALSDGEVAGLRRFVE